ncbi:DUF3352 domain-containing protein [Laspinema olomoucense]|uniref:DUF3352 domain-containing protein n=1 Tax=Laspinema olomoucense TaxID=3231600 RepID=UPI0021BAE515|nr:DUF3352 domain-containing protein [Laspinema sp. D3d]MCT7973726.1 DUF3352 domain-containing protein [Laspinema sp. D3d]
MLKRVTLPVLSVLVLTTGSVLQAQPVPEGVAPTTPLPVTTVLPGDISGVLLIDTRANAWNGLNRFIDLPPGFSGPGFLPYIPAEVNFARDIQPWLGDWTAIALMPGGEGTGRASLQENAVMVAPIQDPNRIPNFVAQLSAVQGQPRERQFQGVTLLEWPDQSMAREQGESTGSLQRGPIALNPLSPFKRNKWLKGWPGLAQTRPILPDSTPTAPAQPDPRPPAVPAPEVQGTGGLTIAIVPGYVAAAQSSAPLERWIATKDTSNSLARDPQFQRTLAHPELGRSLVIGYGNFPELAQLSSTSPLLNRLVPLPASGDINPAGGELTTPYSAIDLMVWMEPQGIRAQSRGFYKTPETEPRGVATPNPMTASLPASTYFTCGGSLNLWQAIGPILGQNLLTLPGLEQIPEFTQSTLGLDVTQDILPWMDGEITAFVFPTNRGFFPTVDETMKLGMGSMIETSDRQSAERVLTQLDELIARELSGVITITRHQINENSVTSWEVINQNGRTESVFAHGWISDKTLMMTTGLGPFQELYPQPYQSLTNAFNFQAALEPLPPPNLGYCYLNMGSFLAWVNTFVPPEINASREGQIVLNSLGKIRSISGTGISQNTHVQWDLFMLLSPRS